MENIKFILSKMYQLGHLYHREVKKEYIVTKPQLDRVAGGKGLTISEEQKRLSAVVGRNIDEPICRFSVFFNNCKVVAECDRWTYTLVFIQNNQVDVVVSGKYTDTFKEEFVSGIAWASVWVGEVEC